MPRSAKVLLVGSTVAYSGKSAAILGMAKQFQDQGFDIAYAKPIGTRLSEARLSEGSHHAVDEDVSFFKEALQLPDDRLQSPILSLDETTVQQRLMAADQVDYCQKLSQCIQVQTGDLVLMEGPGNLEEGTLFNLSLQSMATTIDASVLLVGRFDVTQTVDRLLSAKAHLGDRLEGVIINDVPVEYLDYAKNQLGVFLEKNGIPVLGLLPRNVILRSISVRELVYRLKAEVLCRGDRLDLMVESMTIGAMNVNSALRYFQNARNKVVVTGGDRPDLQLAALETSTQCLVLTGHIPPNPEILSRAEDLEVPILSVDLDTLTTVEIIERSFGQVRFHEPAKVQCIHQLMAQHFDINRLIQLLGLEAAPLTS